MPCVIIVINEDFGGFVKQIEQNASQAVERVDQSLMLKKRSSIKRFIKFAETEGLIFLRDQYLKDITNKMLLWNK